MTSNLEVLEEIGRGGVCVVYRGRLRGEHGTQRTVAIKRLLPERRNDPAAVDLFVQEAKLATRIDHPRLVHAFELRKDDDGYLLLAEWVDGCTLDRLPAPLSAPLVATIGQAVCDALEYLHQMPDGGVIHRDVAPANVFVTRAGEIKLGDLGVAYCADDPAVRPVRSATRGFSAPEQAATAAVDARADVYALGKTLETLTDDAALLSVLERATREDPNERYASAAALREALARFHARVPTAELARLVTARPEGSRPVLDSAVRSILSGATLAPEPARSEARRATLEPIPPPKPSRLFGLLPWIVAAGIASVGVYWSVPVVDPGDESSASGATPEPAPNDASLNRVDADRSNGQAPTDPEPPASGDSAAPGGKQLSAAPEGRRADARTVPITVTKRAPRRPAATTTLTLGCTPWAAVTLDGKPLGNTPLRRVQVPVGKHALVMRHPPTGQSKAIEIELERDTTVIVDLHTDEVKIR